MAGASGKKLDETYKLAWLRGLKTTYYLRTHGRDARREVDRQVGPLNAVSSGGACGRGARRSDASRRSADERDAATDVKFCAIDDPSAKRASERERAMRTSTATRCDATSNTIEAT